MTQTVTYELYKNGYLVYSSQSLENACLKWNELLDKG